MQKLMRESSAAESLRIAIAQAEHEGREPPTVLRPELPPNKKQSFAEVMADLNKCPLFMTEMEENDDIAALQALSYEGTPLENALDFKIRGNECFKVRGYVDAREFYTKGIQLLAAEERRRNNSNNNTTTNGQQNTTATTTDSSSSSPEGAKEESPEEIASQREALEVLYVNRAACNLELENYRSCWTDCASALRLNPSNVKACYRSAIALLQVDRIEEALDICERGIALDAANKSLQQVLGEILERQERLSFQAEKAAALDETSQRREKLLQTALKARNIPTRTTEKPFVLGGGKIELVPDPDDPTSSLSFPAMLLYPEDYELELVEAVNEMDTIEEHLSYVFPMPWDKQREYTIGNVSCFMETKDGGMLKLGRRVPLLEVLGTGKIEVEDEHLRIFVVPHNKADAWVARYKKERAAERAAEMANKRIGRARRW
ncbi:hypothetical protein E4U31_000479 [Claviceps sp. LM219 group G6]|nr:hypothetical protein E4U15_007042 [Claviceps sp. LM218 group G6]KAG6106944.1 hypothetical protein E4U31_000479 [Claviceps sp. LM219 group G6]KAG6113901.1 hypothetical protein E4U14_001593 [Claviceps sp. LM454 group G7]